MLLRLLPRRSLERALVNVKSYEASALGAVARGSVRRRRGPSAGGARVPVPARARPRADDHLRATTFRLSLEVCDHLPGEWTGDVLQRRSLHGELLHVVRRRVALGTRGRSGLPVQLRSPRRTSRPCYQLVTSRILRVIGVRLGADGGDLRLGREELGRVLLRVVRPRCRRADASRPRGDPRALRGCATVRRRAASASDSRRWTWSQNDKTRHAGGRSLRRTPASVRPACYQAIGSIMARSRTTRPASASRLPIADDRLAPTSPPASAARGPAGTRRSVGSSLTRC